MPVTAPFVNLTLIVGLFCSEQGSNNKSVRKRLIGFIAFCLDDY